MRSQAYGTAKTMLCESLVRACVIRYLHRYEGAQAADKAIREEMSRGFVAMAELAALLYSSDVIRWRQFRTFSAKSSGM